MKKITLILLFCLTVVIYAQEESEVKVVSIDQERSETLMYGIDTEVKELITTLKKDKISGFSDELVSLLHDTYDDSIKTLILSYFTEMEISDGEDEAFKIFELIEYEDEYSNSYAVAAINYLSSIGSKKAIENIGNILFTEENSVVESVLSLIGENKVTSMEETLLEMFDDEDTEEQIYLKVIKTLGEIQSQKALEMFIPVLDDDDEETTIRNAICYSLGEIQDVSAIPALKRALENRDNYLLRKSALSALSKFDEDTIDDMLIESLRDPNWQIRFEAIRALSERKVTKAFPILKYKALKDPETKIQKEAFKAIGDINSKESREFLKEVFLEPSYSDSAKLSAIEKLIEHNVEWILPTIEKYYDETNSDKRKPLLDSTLLFLSKAEFKNGGNLYRKMLDHENYIYNLYAINGIRLNKSKEFKDELEDLSTNAKNNNVKKFALSALEEL